MHPDYDYTIAEVIWAVREEMALTLDDVLSRRLRITFLDARAAIAMAPQVATVMMRELEKTEEWGIAQIQEFTLLAKNYLLEP